MCILLISALVYLPYFLVLTAIAYIVLAVFRTTIPIGNKLIYSIFLSFILVFSYHNFLSILIEKQGLVNSYKQSLNQQGYELYKPTYIPDGHELFESRVDKGNLSFYYAGNDARQFVISEFKKPQKIDLTPPDCHIEGDDFEVIDPGDSGWSSAVYGYCQEIKTPKGISVYLMTFNISSEKKLAAISLGNTLITISGYNFSNQELMELVDGLEEKSASDINFKVINRTIGR
ncbi:MAG: hypothetical protein CVU44_14905 [Chloroflexi bacterium HGW-Chloroflexi-6]|nr:MAG: hypothetical protein CVU44_14905 [Chloroflexi bacterium HGW-Chloroflexi-6]